MSGKRRVANLLGSSLCLNRSMQREVEGENKLRAKGMSGWVEVQWAPTLRSRKRLKPDDDANQSLFLLPFNPLSLMSAAFTTVTTAPGPAIHYQTGPTFEYDTPTPTQELADPHAYTTTTSTTTAAPQTEYLEGHTLDRVETNSSDLSLSSIAGDIKPKREKEWRENFDLLDDEELLDSAPPSFPSFSFFRLCLLSSLPFSDFGCAAHGCAISKDILSVTG